MAIRATHEIHTRRRSRNYGVGLVLLGFVVLVFFLTMAKLRVQGPVEGYDYKLRPELAVTGE